jgi:hypothetical protein
MMYTKPLKVAVATPPRVPGMARPALHVFVVVL